MNITQTFYDNLASHYDKLFLDWQVTTREQAVILEKLFADNGFDRSARILDCACGIGTQAMGLAALGYDVTASDISDGALAEARARAKQNNAVIRLEHADFCALSDTFSESDFSLLYDTQKNAVDTLFHLCYSDSFVCNGNSFPL